MGRDNGQQHNGKATVLTPDRAGYMLGSGNASGGQTRDYYNLNLINKAHWSWEIVLYFFLGGLSGGSFLVATIANWLSGGKDRAIIRTGRYISFVAILLSPILLVKDLGRPERFLHMLRVLKLRSVMSIGTWSLSTFGVCCGLITAQQMAKDGLLDFLPPIARLFKALPTKSIELCGAVFAVLVSTYTGVLLAATAVPVWARARHLLGPLFFTSALSTALSAISLLLSLGGRRANKNALARMERAELVAASTELGLIAALFPVLGKLGKPLFTGRNGLLFLGGTFTASLLIPLMTRLGLKRAHRETPNSTNILLSSLTLLGGLILRYVWIDAGRKSADDPHATHLYNAIEWEAHEKRLAEK